MPGIGIKRAVHKGQPAARGKRTVAVVSPFGWEAIAIVPPWAWVIHRAMLSPRPQPSTAWLWLESPRKKGSKMRGRISAGMPGPVLAIASSAELGCPAQAEGYRPFAGVVFDGVVGEVEQQLAQPMAVAGDGEFLAGGHG